MSRDHSLSPASSSSQPFAASPTAIFLKKERSSWLVVIYSCCVLFLSKYDTGDISLDVRKSLIITKFARLRVPLNDDNATVCLQTDGDLGAVLADGEMTRKATAGRLVLQQRELARHTIDGEVDEGVGGDLFSRVIEARNFVDVLPTRGCNEKFVIGLK